MQVKKQQLEPDMKQLSGSKLGKEHVKAAGLFNLYAEYMMRNTGLGESQAGIKIAGENINNLRYVDNTTESETELKSLLMSVERVKKLI